jgi:hypothetical protein
MTGWIIRFLLPHDEPHTFLLVAAAAGGQVIHLTLLVSASPIPTGRHQLPHFLGEVLATIHAYLIDVHPLTKEPKKHEFFLRERTRGHWVPNYKYIS